MPVACAPQTKSLPFYELKSFDDEQGIFEGYLSIFGNIDSYKDIVEPGAFQKTINDARGRGGTYLFPVLWQHDPREPIGGFIDMREDRKGLFVRAQLDLNTPLGQRAYSGLKMGYLDGLSIGYDTIKHKYTSDVRHLLEVRMWEGSVVTFPANDQTRVSSVKEACGETDLPIGPRDEAWDGAKAHGQILIWAKRDDGTLDERKMRSVHLRVLGDPQQVGSYSYPFCVIENDRPRIHVGGVKACAAALSGARGADAGADTQAMQEKVRVLYERINTRYPDAPPLLVPWNKGTPMKHKHFPLSSGPRDFHTVLNDREPDQMMEELYDLLGALVTSMIEHLASADTEGDEQTQNAIATVLDQFKETVLDWTDDALSIGLCQPHDDDDEQEDDEETKGESSLSLAHFTMSTRAMKWAVRSYIKEGRMLSAVNKSRISNALDSIAEAVEELQSLIGDGQNEYDPADEEEHPYPVNDHQAPEKDGKDERGPIVPAAKAALEPTSYVTRQIDASQDDQDLSDVMLQELKHMRLSIRR
jgi:uncharacterized protein